MIMKKKITRILLLYVSVVLVLALGDKLFGNGYRAKIGPIETKTWNEIVESVPNYLGLSAVITIFYVVWFSKIKEK